MPYYSKWQDLPTEAINPDTLAIDKMAVKAFRPVFIVFPPAVDGVPRMLVRQRPGVW